MTATTEHTVDQPAGTEGLPARLRLKQTTTPRGLLDGAWWPRTRDLARELPALAVALDARGDRITRAAVNPRYWPVVPRKVAAAGHAIKVGWFTPELDPHKVLLLSYTVGRWDLLVIPPETAPAAADRLMAAATDGPPRTASALMADEERREEAHPPRESLRRDPGAGPNEGSEQVWEYEGGASPASPVALSTAPGSARRFPRTRETPMTREDPLPGPAFAKIRITAATPEVARLVAHALRSRFATVEQRSHPAGVSGTSTLLDLVLDTAGSPRPLPGRAPAPVGSAVAGRRQAADLALSR